MNRFIRRGPGGVTGAVLVVMLSRFAAVVTSGREHWIEFVPDDAFYYLGFGRGFATSLRWTFDGGVSLSSGFHLLQAYLAASCWAAFHGLGSDAPVYALMLVSLFWNVLAVLVCMRLVTRVFGAQGQLSVALVFLGNTALVCGASGMEWSVAVLALALATEIAVLPNERSGALKACGVGLLAVLARSDSAIWVGALATASLLTYRWANLRLVAALSLGAALGALTVALHTHAITGVWLQDSVLAKIHWGAQHGLNAAGALDTLAKATGLSWLGKGLDRWVLLSLLLFGFGGAASARAEKRAALLASSLTLLGALALGTRNSGGLQYWYTDAAIVPCCLLWAGAFARATQLLKSRAERLLSLGVALSCLASLWQVRSGPWQNQLAMLRAGLHLSDDAWSSCRIGAWNAGILGYYRGHDVVNLDGLANHDALLTSESGQLSSYLAQSKVGYIVDFEAMVERKEFRTRGGYEHASDLQLSEVERAPERDPRWLSSSIVYWRWLPTDLADARDTDCRRTPDPNLVGLK